MEIDLSDDRLASAIHELGRHAYAVEADLIGFDGIPALAESLEQLRARPLRWLASLDPTGTPMAFVAWQHTDTGDIDIDRLCVDPAYFRRSLATGLLTHLLTTQLVGDVTVSTGAANAPAVALYTRLGFVPTGTSEPEPGLLIAHFRLTRIADTVADPNYIP
jgi:ribosomal protein S18 acetylase RimI-like enzyme